MSVAVGLWPLVIVTLVRARCDSDTKFSNFRFRFDGLGVGNDQEFVGVVLLSSLMLRNTSM